MYGINLDKPTVFLETSFRCFDKGEHHIDRNCTFNVLLLVFEGVLRFEEDGISYEVHPEQYFIQKNGGMQTGLTESDCPKYLYIHFLGTQEECDTALPLRGHFNAHALMPLMQKMDTLYKSGSTKTELLGMFYQILSFLYQNEREVTDAEKIAAFLIENYKQKLSLEMLAKHFNFSKNHIINLFKASYGVTPFTYIQNLKMAEAENLLLHSSKTLQNIAFTCGYSDYAQFYKTFFAKHSMSPYQYRNIKK